MQDMWDRCTGWLKCGLPARLLTTLVAALAGLGIVVLLVGWLTDAYSWQYGLIGLAVLWVAAFTVRVFLVAPE